MYRLLRLGLILQTAYLEFLLQCPNMKSSDSRALLKSAAEADCEGGTWAKFTFEQFEQASKFFCHFRICIQFQASG